MDSQAEANMPFVSAVSSRRWLRDTLIEETGLKSSTIRALHKNPRGNTDKIGAERNPIEYIEIYGSSVMMLLVWEHQIFTNDIACLCDRPGIF